MSWFGDFFSPSQDTQQQTTTTQNSSFNNQSQSNTQNNLWPYLQPYFQNYANAAFNPAAFNSYQTNAAGRQDGVSGNLIPGFNAASNIATGGLNPTAYQPYMSQYTSAVVNPTVAEFERLNKSAASDINGSLAKSGALGNSNNNQTRASALAPILNQQKATIAGLYDRGYNQATNTALQSQQQQLGASSTLGGLTGAATGANTAGFNIGQTLWQDPLTWMTQGASSITPFLQGAGMNTNNTSSGSSTGTSVGNTLGSTTYNPSLFQDIAGIAGLGLSLWGKKADGGAVTGYEDGGQVSAIPAFHNTDLPTKVAHAFTALHGIRERAKGGTIPAYDAGGPVLGSWTPTQISSFDPSSTMGNDVVAQAQSNQFGMDASKAGDKLLAYSGMMDQPKDMNSASANASRALDNQGAQLSAFMQKYNQAPQIQGYANGGVPDDNDPGTVDSVDPYVIPKFPKSDDLTYSGANNDPGVTPLAAMTPFKPRVADAGGFGSPYSHQPLTVRYNNPGAVEFKPWMTQYGANVGPNGRYAQFDTPENGYRVMDTTLDTYRDKHGLNTVSGIINRWAPRSVDNNSTDAYVRSVAKNIGVDPNAELKPEHRDALKTAMASYEAGTSVAGPGNASVASSSPSMEGRMSLGGPKEEPSFFDKVASALSSSPLGSGNWTTGTGPAARALLAASGPHIGAPIAQQASEMVRERLAQQQADQIHKRALAQMAQSAQHHADDIDYRNRSLAQTGSHQQWIERHGDQPELVRQLVAAGIDPKSDKGRQILEDSIKGNDPIAQIISERLRGVTRPQAGGVQPQSFDGQTDAAPRLQPISDAAQSPAVDPNLVLAQAAQQGKSQSQEATVDTPIGKIPMSEAKQIGGLMLSSPRYKSLGEHILKQTEKMDENRALGTAAKTEVDKAIVSGANHLGRLEEIGRDFDPKFLTVPYRAGSAYGAGLEKLGIEMDPETKAERERYSQFRSKTAGNLNALLKELSGSAVTQNEYERMLIQEPNAGTGGMLDIVRGDNPTDFQSKLNSSKAMAKMAIARANWLRTSQNFSSDAVASMAKNGTLSTYAPLDNMKKIMDTTQGQIMQNLKASNPSATEEQLIPTVRQRMNQIFGI